MLRGARLEPQASTFKNCIVILLVSTQLSRGTAPRGMPSGHLAQGGCWHGSLPLHQVNRVRNEYDNIAVIHETTMSAQPRDNLLFTLLVSPVTDH